MTKTGKFLDIRYDCRRPTWTRRAGPSAEGSAIDSISSPLGAMSDEIVEFEFHISGAPLVAAPQGVDHAGGQVASTDTVTTRAACEQ